jgi:hypothetical protein
LATVLGATFFNAGTGSAGMDDAFIFTVSGLGSSRLTLAAMIRDGLGVIRTIGGAAILAVAGRGALNLGCLTGKTSCVL